MGKVKVRVVGDEQQEQEALAEQKQKREEKAAKKASVKGVGLGGGERINSVGVSEEEIAAQIAEETKPAGAQAEAKEDKREKKSKKAKEARTLSKRHTDNASHVAASTLYPVKMGIETLRKFKNAGFDETVELHINVKEKGINGQVSLPHGTGKKLRIAIADDAIIADVEKGKINFDILVAEPAMMPKLAKVAKILGPRGLMPNPKNGTISPKPAEVVEKLSAGQISYKTEAQAPIIHMSVGKLSFKDDQLNENITSALTSIGTNKIEKVVLKSTMSPAVRLQI